MKIPSLALLLALNAQSFASQTEDLTVRKVYFRDGTSVSKEFYYQDNILVETRIYNLKGENTTRLKWKLLENGNWIRERLKVEDGSLESRVELRMEEGVSPENAMMNNSFTVKEWNLSKDLSKKPHTIDIFETNESLPASKVILDAYENVASRIQYFYQEGADRPYAFEEKKEGVVIRQFELYEPFSPEKVWKNSSLSEDEIQKRRDNLKREDKFLVAIIDSGFDYNHIELAHHWYVNPKDPMDGIDNDGNGWIDDTLGWERERGIGLPTESSTRLHHNWRPHSHGTHVAHIAVRDLWGVGLIGFAGDYTKLDYLKRISRYLKEHKVKVVNMSLGLPADIRNVMGLRDAKYVLRDMVKENPETLFVVAAGNSIPGVDIDEFNNHQYPANIESDNVITVGSINSDRILHKLLDEYALADFSNFGKRHVDILAPGEKVSAASLGGGEIVHSGTSMATPYMVNEVIRLWKAYPEFSASEIKEIFMSSVHKLPSLPLVKSEGLVNREGAFETAKKKRMEKRWSYAKSIELTENGPNCWNSALYLSGLVDEIREVTHNEFRRQIESKRCQKVDEPQLGDIVALRRTNASGRPLKHSLHSEIHAYTYKDEEVGFTKNGFHKNNPYEEQSHSEILSRYEKTNKKDCRIMGVPSEYCHLAEEFYRCH